LEGDLTLEAGKTRVRIQGKLLELFGEDPKAKFTVSSEHVTPILREVVGDSVGGAIRTKIHVRGPLESPVAEGDFSGLEMAVLGVQAKEMKGSFVLSRKSVKAKNVEGEFLRGRFSGSANLNFASGDWKGKLRSSGVAIGDMLKGLPGELEGEVLFSGQTKAPFRQLAVMDLVLKRPAGGWLPSTSKLTGTVHLSPAIIDLADVTISGEGNRIKVSRGSINLKDRRTNLYLHIHAPRFDKWLEGQEIAPAVRSVNAEMHVTGTFPQLKMVGNLTAGEVGYGAIRLPKIESKVSFSGGSLRLEKIRSVAMGGNVRGEASLDLFEGDVTRPKQDPTVRALLRVESLDVSDLGAGEYVKGRLSGSLDLAGTLNDLKGTAELKLPSPVIEGDPYGLCSLRFGILKDRVSVYRSNFPRSGGGLFKVRGDVFYDGRLKLRVSADSCPVKGVPGASDIPLGLAGLMNGKLEVSGTLSDPRFGGTIKLTQAQLREMKLGTGTLEITPASDSIRIKGDFFDGLLRAQGYILLHPQVSLHMDLDVKRFPLEKVVHELRRFGDVRGLIDGQIRFDADAERGLTSASVKLSKLRLWLRHRPLGSPSLRTVLLANRGNMVGIYQDGQFQVVEATLVPLMTHNLEQGGEFSLSGVVSPKKSDLRLQGKIALNVLEFFLARWVQKIDGEALVNVHVAGPWNRPELEGSLFLTGAVLHMPKFDEVIRIPSGKLKLKVPGSLELEQFEFTVGTDKFVATGQVSMDDQFGPTAARLHLVGDLNMRLLELFFPEQFSWALGSVGVKLDVDGPVTDPSISGELEIRRIDLAPRGWGRVLTLTSGRIGFDKYYFRTVDPLIGSYDEGSLRMDGEVRFDSGELVDLYLDIVGTAIPLRKPRVFSAETNFKLTLVGDNEQLALTGDVDLVDGRYIREFDILKSTMVRPRVFEEETPLWKDWPLLEELKLGLKLRSAGELMVKNRYGKMSLSGDLEVGGTLGNPRLRGQIRAEEANFRFPFLRGEYTLDRGEIVFDDNRPVDDAVLDVVVETVHNDVDGVEYKIKLGFKGTLGSFQMDLNSEPELPKGQIAVLLATGRTTDKLRNQLRGSGQEGASDMADAQLKEVSQKVFSALLSDRLRQTTGLDLFQLEAGAKSVEVRVGKKLGRYIDIDGEYEQDFLGDNREKGRIQFLLHDYLKLMAKAERLNTHIETEQGNPNRYRLQLRFQVPIR
ncbi:MAG: translocation/assembly module TamB domain-containing protein, partial [Pseudomonadota bacterium]